MSNPEMQSLDAQKVCTLGGLQHNRLTGKLIELKDIEKTLDVAIKEVAKATKDEYFWRAMEVSAKLVQVSCDLAIAVLEESAAKVGAGVGGKAVSVIYDVAKLLVDGMNSDITVKKALIYNANVKLDAVAEILTSKGSNYGKAVSRTKILANMANDLYEYWDNSGKKTITAKSGLIVRYSPGTPLKRLSLW